MKLTVYHHETVFDALAAEWNALVKRSIADNVFSTLEWQVHWWAAYRPGKLWVIACRNADGHLLGIAPWFIETTAEGERIVRGIGCVDVTDYVDCIVDAACIEPVFGAFAEYLAENTSLYDRICLCNIPHYSPTFKLFPPILEQAGFATHTELQEVCPIISLPNDWEGYLEALDKKNRHELRRKMRRGSSEGGLDWYIVNDSHNLDEQLTLFLKLMAESSPNKAEFLQNEQNLTFFKRIMPMIYANGWLHLTFLTINGEPAATYLNFDYNQRVMVYNSGFAQKHLNASPGILLLAYTIRHAIEHGYTEFDFLRGNEEYKYRMGGKDAPVYMLKAQRA